MDLHSGAIFFQIEDFIMVYMYVYLLFLMSKEGYYVFTLEWAPFLKGVLYSDKFPLVNYHNQQVRLVGEELFSPVNMGA